MKEKASKQAKTLGETKWYVKPQGEDQWALKKMIRKCRWHIWLKGQKGGKIKQLKNFLGFCTHCRKRSDDCNIKIVLPYLAIWSNIILKPEKNLFYRKDIL